jgi:hypothetical protein
MQSVYTQPLPGRLAGRADISYMFITYDNRDALYCEEDGIAEVASVMGRKLPTIKAGLTRLA